MISCEMVSNLAYGTFLSIIPSLDSISFRKFRHVLVDAVIFWPLLLLLPFLSYYRSVFWQSININTITVTLIVNVGLMKDGSFETTSLPSAFLRSPLLID